MTKNLMPSIVLSCICIVVALLLAGVNMITGPIIEANQNAAANEALLEVLPDGKNFKEIEITENYPAIVTAGYTADGGTVFQMTVTGKSSGMIIMCGIDSDGKIVSTKVIANEETPSYAEKVFPNVEGTDSVYAGMDLAGFEPYLVSGATLTSKAYGEAIKAALQAAAIAGGADVDTRTPEQILQDNCNAALGTEGKTFTKWFATEVIEGIDAVYETDGGRVYVIGESFVGIKADGTVATADATEENKTMATTADTIIKTSTTTEITELPAGIKADVTKVSVTTGGNYVFEVLAYGYKYESNYEFAGVEEGEFKIMISIAADGKIIDVLTLYHEESKGYGDACATEEYYEQYRGHENGDIVITVPMPDFHDDQIPNGCTDIGAISSSTFTTTAYQVAVKSAFAAFELLTNS